jgi:hypothetical protein
LNTETGAISPDRGNHAIRVTETGRTHPGIPRRVRYLVCTWLDGQCGHLLPHRWLQPGLCGPAGAAFRDELVTHAQGAVLQESIFAGAGRRSRAELVVLAHDAQGISAHAEMNTLRWLTHRCRLAGLPLPAENDSSLVTLVLPLPFLASRRPLVMPDCPAMVEHVSPPLQALLRGRYRFLKQAHDT